MEPCPEASPFDGSAVQYVPQNVEKLPLFHWRPGSRLLAVGSRDGARFDGGLDPSEARTFRRPLNAELLDASQRQFGTDGIAAVWSNIFAYPQVAALLLARSEPLVVVAAGHGDGELCQQLCRRAAAWVLLIDEHPGERCRQILESAAHVEIVLGLGDPPPAFIDLPLARAAAIHLQPRRASSGGEDLAVWEAAARAALPSTAWLYDSGTQHSRCPGCGETLVWRSHGRSRLDSLGPDARCKNCGAAAGFCLA